MDTYLTMLYISLEQELALKAFFKSKGWSYTKADLSMVTDKVGPLCPAKTPGPDTSAPSPRSQRKAARAASSAQTQSKTPSKRGTASNAVSPTKVPITSHNEAEAEQGVDDLDFDIIENEDYDEDGDDDFADDLMDEEDDAEISGEKELTTNTTAMTRSGRKSKPTEKAAAAAMASKSSRGSLKSPTKKLIPKIVLKRERAETDATESTSTKRARNDDGTEKGDENIGEEASDFKPSMEEQDQFVFDYDSGMLRLEQAARDGFNILRQVVGQELATVGDNLCFTDSIDISGCFEMDTGADDLLKRHSTFKGVPMIITNDGNSLFNAISFLMIGNESRATELRYKTALTMVLDEEELLQKYHYEESLLKGSPDFDQALCDCAVRGKTSNIWTIMALTKVVMHPINVMYLEQETNSGLETKSPLCDALFNVGCSVQPLLNLLLPDFVGDRHESNVAAASGFGRIVPVIPLYIEEEDSTPTLKGCLPFGLNTASHSLTNKASFSKDVTQGTVSALKTVKKSAVTETISSEQTLDVSTFESLQETHEDVPSADTEGQDDVADISIIQGPSTSSNDTFQKDYGPYSGPLDSRFMLWEDTLQKFTGSSSCLPKIPRGLKENVYFLVDSSDIMRRKKAGLTAEYKDDCGKWEKCTVAKAYFRRTENGFQNLAYKRGLYYIEHKRNGKNRRHLELLDPQPTFDVLLIVSRAYAYLKACNNYRKRTSYVVRAPRGYDHLGRAPLVVEYIGKYPGKMPEIKETEHVSSVVSVGLQGPHSGPLDHGEFMPVNSVMSLFTDASGSLSQIPTGPKENVFFLIDSADYVHRCKMGVNSEYCITDDCTEWKKNSLTKQYYRVLGDSFQHLLMKDGLFYAECQRGMASNVQDVLDPQPVLDSLLIVGRQYSYLKWNTEYKRRLSYVIQAPPGFEHLAQAPMVVEYVGRYPKEMPDQTENEANLPLVEGERVPTIGLFRGKLENQFISTVCILRLLTNVDGCLPNIPTGIKENVYFLVDNTDNRRRTKEGKKRMYWDDCGAWDKGTLSKVYLQFHGDTYKHLALKDGLFCPEQRGKAYEPLKDQPAKESLLILGRAYNNLKLCKQYKRRITFVMHTPPSHQHLDNVPMLVEYIGRFPGHKSHGRTKDKLGASPYIRTKPEVLKKAKEVIKIGSPAMAHELMQKISDPENLPRNLKQFRNLKYFDNKRKKKEGKMVAVVKTPKKQTAKTGSTQPASYVTYEDDQYGGQIAVVNLQTL